MLATASHLTVKILILVEIGGLPYIALFLFFFGLRLLESIKLEEISPSVFPMAHSFYLFGALQTNSTPREVSVRLLSITQTDNRQQTIDVAY